MRLTRLSLIAPLVLAACAGAATVAPMPAANAPAVADAPIEAPSGDYALDPAHTRVTWKVMHLGLSRYVGRFERVAGALTLDAAAPTQSRVAIEMDARSISTGHRDAAGAETFDARLAREVLGADTQPAITFVSTRAERTGPASGRLYGDLSFNGVTRPVTLDVVLNGARLVLVTGRQTVGVSARTTINRSEWGADDWAAFVGDAVEIEIEAEFQKK